MRTSFQGLVHLPARSLYPEPEVFIQELLQNAHDSIQLRRVQEPKLAGEICVSADPQTRTLSFISLPTVWYRLIELCSMFSTLITDGERL